MTTLEFALEREGIRDRLKERISEFKQQIPEPVTVGLKQFVDGFLYGADLVEGGRGQAYQWGHSKDGPMIPELAFGYEAGKRVAVALEENNYSAPLPLLLGLSWGSIFAFTVFAPKTVPQAIYQQFKEYS